MSMLLFFWGGFALSSPQQDFRIILSREEECDSAVLRLLPQHAYLRTQEQHKDLDYRLLAQSLLLLEKQHIDEDSLLLEINSIKQKTQGPIPPHRIVHMCTMLQIHSTHRAASHLISAGFTGLWLHPCLPILINRSFEDTNIWNFLATQSQGFPNQNEIRTHFKRKGSERLIFFMKKLPYLKSEAEISLVHDLIWGLVPPTIPVEAEELLRTAQENGPLSLFSDTKQRVFVQKYRAAIDSLVMRFRSHRDARISMDSTDIDPYLLLRQSICGFR